MKNEFFDPRGLWVLVTGGAKRVGADIARYMAARGLNIFLHYHTSRDAAEKLKEELKKNYGVRIGLVTGDLSKEEDVKKLFASISPDIIVSNAGAFEKGDFDRNIAVNMRSAYYLAQEASQRMLRDKKEGVVFLVGDAFLESGGVYPENLVGYTMSKAYIPYVVRQLAAEHGRSGLRFNAVLNGPIEPLEGTRAEVVAAIAREINLPKKRLNPWIGGWQVGEAIYGLLISPAVNGATLLVDGGRAPRVGEE